jgi:phosphoglycolate phosphatase
MDSTHSIVAAIQNACRDLELPVPSDEQASWVIGLSLEAALRQAVPELTTEKVPDFLARYRIHYLLRDPDLKLFDGIMELLACLSGRGVKLAVATGKSRVGLDRALKATSLGPVFDDTRCADETFSKPHPQMLFELMESLQVDAADVIMVGDTTHDIQMATSAGIASVAVTYGAHSVGELNGSAPTAIVDSVAALREWLLPRVRALAAGAVAQPVQAPG